MMSFEVKIIDVVILVLTVKNDVCLCVRACMHVLCGCYKDISEWIGMMSL